MTKSLKVAVVGDRESVLGFRALGLEVATPKTPDEARNAVDRLAREGSAVIFLTERLAEQIPETVERYICLLYTSPSPRDKRQSRMPSSA